MRISWDIQKTKRRTRSKALQAAWAIFNNEEVAIHYLTRKLNHNKPIPTRTERQFALFTN